LRAHRQRCDGAGDAPARRRTRCPRRGDAGEGIVRLSVLDNGHTFSKKALFVMIRALSRHPVQDVVKTLMYRPEFFGGPMGQVFQELMRGPAEWSVGDRELMAAFVSKTNECEF